MVSALLFGKSYGAFIKKRESEGEELLRFLLHIKGEVSRFLSTPESICASFRSDILFRTGFLPLSEGGSLADALESAELSISMAMHEVLSEFFSGFGKNYLEAEISRCTEFCERLDKMLSKEKEEYQKNVRVVKTVSAAAALGIVILLI